MRLGLLKARYDKAKINAHIRNILSVTQYSGILAPSYCVMGDRPHFKFTRVIVILYESLGM